MNSKFMLNKEEQYFIMEILEISDVQEAFDRFTEILIEEGGDPHSVDKYIKRILVAYKEKKGKL